MQTTVKISDQITKSASEFIQVLSTDCPTSAFHSGKAIFTLVSWPFLLGTFRSRVPPASEGGVDSFGPCKIVAGRVFYCSLLSFPLIFLHVGTGNYSSRSSWRFFSRLLAHFAWSNFLSSSISPKVPVSSQKSSFSIGSLFFIDLPFDSLFSQSWLLVPWIFVLVLSLSLSFLERTLFLLLKFAI